MIGGNTASSAAKIGPGDPAETPEAEAGAEHAAAIKRLPLGWKLRYKWPSQLRCALGIHTLRARAAPLTEDQIEAVPMHPRGRPGPGDHRVCTWCGARWKGAYDGIEPHWRRVA